MTHPSEQTPSIGADQAFCAAMLPLVSRTFALSIEALPESLREPVRLAYLMCRLVDTIEDQPQLPPVTRTALFDRFDALIADDSADASVLTRLTVEVGLGVNEDERALCAGAGALWRSFRRLPEAQRQAIRPHVQTMARGMREFCERTDREGKLRLASLPELERYCYYVAGTVGELLTALFSQYARLGAAAQAFVSERAVSFGLGLQLVNIIKDVAGDYERGVCFLPLDLAATHQLDLDRLLDPAQRQRGRAVINAVCARAREHLDRAAAYTIAWPAPEALAVRLFCAVPLAIALATLWEVEHGPDTLLAGHEPKVTRDTVTYIFSAAISGAADDAALRQLFDFCRAGASAPQG